MADQLCNASASGNLPRVLVLLQSGAHVNGLNKYNRTALQVGNFQLLLLLTSKMGLFMFFCKLWFFKLVLLP